MTGDPLTKKEREVLTLHNLGHSQRTIALRLGISREAVRDRITRAKRKLGKDKAA